VLPEKSAELETVRNDLFLRQNEVHAKEKTLAELDVRLAELEAVEKLIVSLENESQLLAVRIKNGNDKIEEQKLRVGESQQALQVVTASKDGKESFDRMEARLTELRLQVQLRRAVEQEIVALDKQALTLAQKLAHEQAEISQSDAQLAADQKKLTTDRHSLQPDAELSLRAGRLEELRREADVLKNERSLLAGRRESLLEGKGKLAEGVCPFFQEQCKNIAASAAPRDLFAKRLEELDFQAARLDESLSQLALQLKAAETAEKELTNRFIRLQEADKQINSLEERNSKNRAREKALEPLVEQLAEATEMVTLRKADLQVFADLDTAVVTAEQERQSHQPARDAYTANLNVALDLEPRQQSLQKMLQLLETVTADLNTRLLELTQKKQGFQPEQLLQTRREKEQLLAETAALRQQGSELCRTSERLERELAQLKLIQEEIDSKQLEIKSFENKEKLVRFLRNQVFKNVSALLSERFREEISSRADRIYRTIAETDEELYWGDNYQIVLKDMQNGTIRERNDDQLSGGQTMSAVVALRLALLQTIGARIAFFDEPTSNLDAARRENLAQAFRAIDVGREEVTEHWYDQLFLISHDVAFTEITDQIIQVGV